MKTSVLSSGGLKNISSSPKKCTPYPPSSSPQSRELIKERFEEKKCEKTILIKKKRKKTRSDQEKK